MENETHLEKYLISSRKIAETHKYGMYTKNMYAIQIDQIGCIVETETEGAVFVHGVQVEKTNMKDTYGDDIYKLVPITF